MPFLSQTVLVPITVPQAGLTGTSEDKDEGVKKGKPPSYQPVTELDQPLPLQRGSSH